jgi:hypothetical protein
MVSSSLIGQHGVEIDGELVTLRMRGPVSLEETERCLATVEQVMAERGRAFLIIDHRQVGPSGPEVRRCMAEWARGHSVSGIAIFGASLPMRTVSVLLIRGIALLYSRPDLIERVALVRSEAEARAFIAERRARLDAATTRPPAPPAPPAPPGPA